MHEIPRLSFHILIILLAGCASDTSSSSEVSISDSAGVQVVENAAADVALDWRFEEVFAIGRMEEDKVLFDEMAPYRVDVDSAGRLYVLDELENRVAVFDTKGELVRTLGRQGRGPGELTMPTAISVQPGGEVAVYDAGRKALVRWDADGETLSQRDVPSEFWGPDIFAQEERLVFTRLAAPEAGTAEQVLVEYRLGRKEREMAHLSQPSSNSAEFPSCGYGGMPIAPLFAPELVWDAAGKEVVASAGPAYVVDRFEGGQHVQRIRRDIAPRRATYELALEEAGDGMVLEYPQRCRVPPEEVVEGRGFADTIPAIERVTLDPTGQLWVRRYAVGNDPAQIDLFNAAGEYKGTLPDDAPFPIAFLTSDLIVAVRDGDVPHIAAYRLTR